MRCAAPLRLQEDFGRRRRALGFGRHRIAAGSHNHRRRGAAGLADRVEHMGEQRSAGDGAQYLRPRRAHAGALAGRQHDR
jgi:hypothetical protein